MYDFPLTGAQRAMLRSRAQTLEPALKVGRGGLTPAFFAELQRLLRARELVKLRFLGADRDERTTLCEKIADEGRCVCVGAVGHTALFYRQNPDRRAHRCAAIIGSVVCSRRAEGIPSPGKYSPTRSSAVHGAGSIPITGLWNYVDARTEWTANGPKEPPAFRTTRAYCSCRPENCVRVFRYRASS